MTATIVAWLEKLSSERRTAVLVLGVCGFAVASALAAQVRFYLPFSPVPVTLQTFVVLLAGATLGAGAGMSSQMLYLGAGAVGAPVFAGAVGTPRAVTFGYLAAFPLAAWVVGYARDRFGKMGLPAGLVAGNLVIYLLGAGWLAVITDAGLMTAVTAGIVPFLAGDAVKTAGAALSAGIARTGFQRALGE